MNSLSKTFLIYGVSKGLGKAIAKLIPNSIDMVYGGYRSAPEGIYNLNWICTDLSNSEDVVHKVKKIVGEEQVDILIYNVGI